MDRPHWQDILLPPGNEDQIWEVFHENSKVSRYSKPLSAEEIRARTEELHEVLNFEGYPIIDLPRSLPPLEVSLSEAITTRTSCRDMRPCRLSLGSLATLLYHAYGVTRDKSETRALRSFRVVPSGGALYPLEIFFHSTWIDGVAPGLYHYNPIKHHLRFIKGGDATREISEGTVYPDLVLNASLMIFITGVFERSIFKYGDRGYRFILLEAGHVAQNVNLVAMAVGLGSVNIGGFYDRAIDDIIGLDGVTHSTLYMIALGKKTEVGDGEGKSHK